MSADAILKITMVHNHIKLGVSLRVLYCVSDTGYGLGNLWGIADLHCKKVESNK